MNPNEVGNAFLRNDLPSLPELLKLKTALVIAHPGHECRIAGWVERTRPSVSILTDGSGRSGRPRIARTESWLRSTGSTPAPLFGAASDLTVYQAILDRRMDFFEDLVHQLADSLVRDRVDLVLGDSAEGEIMVHDLFREVRRAAVKLAEQSRGYPIHHFEFPLESHPLAFPPGHQKLTRRLNLSDADFRRKMEMARSYEQIAPFVDAAIEAHGEEAFSVESIFPATADSLLPQDRNRPMPYEQHGQEQCRLGNYRELITFKDHVRPIAEQILGMTECGESRREMLHAAAG
jgi:hypothetical protein